MVARHRPASADHLRPGARALLVALVVCTLVSPSLAGATIVWDGGFETGDLTQWDRVQAIPGDITPVTSPRRSGLWGVKVVVHPGDNTLISTGDRAELVEWTVEHAGTSSWWSWSTYFPSSFYTPAYSKWNVFAQWHPRYANFNPNVCFTVVNWGPSGVYLEMTARGGSPTAPTERSWNLGALQRSHWYDFVLRVDWYTDNAGSVRLWVDGALVVPKTFTPTYYTGVREVYVKEGLYRGPFDQTSTLYEDAMRRGTSSTDFLPAS